MSQTDVVSNFELHRFILCVLLAAVGAIAVLLGYFLFSKGAGLFKAIEGLAVQNPAFKVSVTGMSAGGALMLTSVAWGFWSYSAVPHLNVAANDIKIAALPGNNNNSTASFEIPYSTFAGANVYSSDDKKVGTVAGVLIDGEQRPTAFTVNLDDTTSPSGNPKQIMLYAKDLQFPIDEGSRVVTIFNRHDAIDRATVLEPGTRG